MLIDYLLGIEIGASTAFQQVLDNNIPFGINSFIYQEVLQGVKTAKDFDKAKKYLVTQRFYCLSDDKESYEKATRIYFDCRRKGVTITSSIDCLIAQTAIENNLYLLHNDSDFDHISKVAKLKIFRLSK